MRYDLVHQTYSLGLLGVDFPAGEYQFTRLGHADETGQVIAGSAIGYHAPLDENSAEARFIRGNPHITGQSQTHAAAGSYAVDRSDNRLRHVANLEHYRGHMPHSFNHIADNRSGEFRPALNQAAQVADIPTGTESLAGTGYDNDPDALIRSHVIDSIVYRSHHREVEGVVRLRPVQGYCSYHVLFLYQHSLFGHLVPPLILMATRALWNARRHNTPKYDFLSI